jgi:hypothetical protein
MGPHDLDGTRQPRFLWNASTISDAEPSPAPVPKASCASMSRQFEGLSPDCASARTASAPFRKSEKRTDAEALNVGTSCTRIHASVMTPSMPSEPMNIRSG